MMTMWRCNKDGTYPNFYAVTFDKRDYVFFDVDGETDRLYLVTDESDRYCRYWRTRKWVMYQNCM